MTDSYAIHDDRQTDNLLVLFWLLLAGGVLCFFLADNWMDALLYNRQSKAAIGYISNETNTVRMRPRSTLSWLDTYQHLGVESGDTVYVGAHSHVTLTLKDGMKLQLGSNSLAQISFGTQDTINVKLAAGTVQVVASRPTAQRVRLNTGFAEKLLAGPELRHVTISKTDAQTLKVVEAPTLPKTSSRKVAMIQKPSIKPTITDADLLNDFDLSMAPSRSIASVNAAPQAFVGPPTPPDSVLKAAIKQEAAQMKPPAPKIFPFGRVNVDQYQAIHFSDSPEEDTQALIKWQALPRVQQWEIVAKNTDTGAVQNIKTSKPEYVVNGENPGHYEYVMRGLDSLEKPITKDSKPVSLDVRTPLQVPLAQSPINNAMVLTDEANRNDFVMLRWQSVNSEHYQLEIADNPDFESSKTISLNHSTYVFKVNKPMPKVYWRVRAIRDQDTSAWSAASFQMANAN